MITTRKLWGYLRSKGIVKTKFLTDKILPGQTYYNLTKDRSITMNTLNTICEYLQCQPGDILEWIPDEEVSK